MPLGTYKPTRVAVQAVAETSDSDLAKAVRERVLQVVRDAASNAPRNVQRAIGPSEFGHPCARNVAFKLRGSGGGRDLHDPWPSIVGVAVHSWLADVFEADNIRHPGTWLTEHRVTVAEEFAGFPALSGTSDLFHVPSGTVLDHKILGNTQHREYVSGYVSEQYKNQIHAYGLGLVNAGYTVNHVGLLIFSRAKTLRDLYVHTEPWDRERAEATVRRLRDVQRVVAAGIDPMNVKATAGGGCHFCAWRPSCPEGKNQT